MDAEGPGAGDDGSLALVPAGAASAPGEAGAGGALDEAGPSAAGAAAGDALAEAWREDAAAGPVLRGVLEVFGDALLPYAPAAPIASVFL